jgi:hypothetical protein
MSEQLNTSSTLSTAIPQDNLTFTSKLQPWRTVFPNSNPDNSQMQKYGIKAGQKLELFGNAGNFFTDGRWVVEYDTAAKEA